MHNHSPRLYLILLPGLLLGPGACAWNDRHTAVHSECPQMIKQAEELYEARQAEFDKMHNTRIANLIKAARRDQEVGQHTSCMDKASRALLLANQTARSDI